MNRFNRPGFSAPFFIAVVSLIISSCAGGGGGTTTPKPTPGPLPLPVINVPNLHLLAPMSMPVGAAVPAGRAKNSVLKSIERQTIVNHHFSQITAENVMKPSYLHPAESTFFFDDADALVDYAAGQDKTVHGHTLIWHYGLAKWMDNFTGDAEAWTTMMTDHITEIVSHFAAGALPRLLRNPWDHPPLHPHPTAPRRPQSRRCRRSPQFPPNRLRNQNTQQQKYKINQMWLKKNIY